MFQAFMGTSSRKSENPGCLQKKIDKTTYLVEVHFSATSTQSVEEKLKRVILHDLQHGKQGRPRKSDEK